METCPKCGSPATTATGTCGNCGDLITGSATRPKQSRTARVVVIAVVIAVVTFGILASYPSFVEPFLPQLNDFLHSGTPTATSDIEFLLTRIDKDMKQIDAACVPGSPGLRDSDDPIAAFTECRRQILSTRPAYDDLKAGNERLQGAWELEKSQRAVPAECRDAIDKLYPHLNGYLNLKGEEFNMFQSLKPETATRIEMGNAARRMSELEREQVAHILAFNPDEITRIERVCKGY